jgi:GPH family glycoside/pentoside/hexuronide:cation symporter
MAAGQDAKALGLGVSTAFGLGAMSAGVVAQSLNALVLLFYNQVVGMSPASVGLALMISLVFDAFWDPAIGLWSDNSRSRIGRRHPFMYASILPAGVAFWLLWSPPHGLSESGAFAWLLVTLLAVRFFISLYEVPSTALAPELAPDYDARTGLLGLRYFWGVLGGVLISILAFQVFLSDRHGGVTSREGFAATGIAGATIICITLLVSCLGTHRSAARFVAPPPEKPSPAALFGQVRAAITNRNFAAIMISALFAGTASGLSTGLGMYFNLYFWGLSTDQLSLLVLPGIGASVIGVFLAPAVARRWGKKPVAVVLFALSVFTAVLPMSLRLLGLLPGNDWPLLVPFLFVETLVAGTLALMVMIIVTSMLADVVEDNAVRTGQRSEGLFFAANSILAKSVTGVGAFGSGLMLTLVDFPRHAAPGQVSREVVHHLGFIFLPVALTLSALSLVALAYFRIDRATHEANLSRLRAASLAGEASGELGLHTDEAE